ncbi:MAG: 4Fe-4S binding protein [Oscillospiraceae bacterium]|nr:4Fe-4S binding protein [Oscillospiraceae bacterium]
MKNKIKISRLARHLIQAAAFLFFPGLFLSIFTALRDVVVSLASGTFSFSGMADRLVLLAAVFLLTALWGRFFCGYLCAFGSVQELAARISERLHVLKTVPEKADRILKYVKYAVLALIVVLLWILQLPADSGLSPWGVFGMLLSGNLSVMRAAVPTLGFIALIAILIAGFFAERFFCRYLCPLGALLSLASGRRIFFIRRKKTACGDCGLCTRKCAMGISVHDRRTVRSGECIDCMRCAGACRTGALSCDPLPAAGGTAAALMLCGLVYAGGVAVNRLTDTTAGSADGGTYDGAVFETYAASGNDAVAEDGADGGEYSVPLSVNARQDQDDAASAETVTEDDSGDAAGIPAGETAETEEAGETAESGETEETDETAEDPEPEEELPSEPEGPYADGVYTGAGTGFRGTTQVEVTVENGMIADITVLSYEDDRQYFSRAQEGVIAGILYYQSLDVGTVSGATFSSNGILEAVADALGMDFMNPNGSGGGHGRGR